MGCCGQGRSSAPPSGRGPREHRSLAGRCARTSRERTQPAARGSGSLHRARDRVRIRGSVSGRLYEFDRGQRAVVAAADVPGDGQNRPVRTRLVRRTTSTCRVALGDLDMDTQRQKHLVLILAREFASNLSTPTLIADARGYLVYYNEAAEAIVGMRFAEAGEMPLRRVARPLRAEDDRVGPVTARASSGADRVRRASRIPPSVSRHERGRGRARDRGHGISTVRAHRRVRGHRRDLLARLSGVSVRAEDLGVSGLGSGSRGGHRGVRRQYLLRRGDARRRGGTRVGRRHRHPRARSSTSSGGARGRSISS